MKVFDKYRFFAAALLWVGLVLLPVIAAVADDASQSPPPPVGQQASDKPPPAADNAFPAQPPPVEKRGFLNDIGAWWDRSVSGLTAKMKAAGEKLEGINKTQDDAASATKDALSNAAAATKDVATATKDALSNAATATKDAAAAIVRLPGTRVLELNDRCAVAANGAPDCSVAASNACRQKGFSSGRAIDVRTSQDCPPAVILSGQPPAEGECKDETVVLRAVCQ